MIFVNNFGTRTNKVKPIYLSLITHDKMIMIKRKPNKNCFKIQPRQHKAIYLLIVQATRYVYVKFCYLGKS